MKYLLVLLFSFVLVVVANATTITGPFVSGTGNWDTINNGGFETGLSGWTLIGSSIGAASVTTSPSIFGTSSGTLTPIQNFNGPGYAITQTISVTAGEEYVLSGFFNTSNLINSHLYMDLNDQIFEVNVGANELVMGEEEWQFSWASFVPNVDNITLRIIQDWDTTIGENAYFDEIAVTLASEFEAPTVSSVPEPTTLAILCLGLVGIGFSRKRLW